MPFGNDPMQSNDLWDYISKIMQAGSDPNASLTAVSPAATANSPFPTAGTVTGLAAPGVGGAGIVPGGSAPNPTSGVFAPFGGNEADSPPAWLAKNALAAYQKGDTKYRDHLLSDPTIAGDPHLKNFIMGLFAGDPDRIKEANYYASNPSYNGWNDAAGDGIAGDGK